MKKPQPFGKYLLLERINVGGMAEVFLAKVAAPGGERIVAIKKIIPTMVEDEEFITMFLDEARIAVQLNHPNVVQIQELGKQEEHYYIVMEYVSGRDLRILLDTVKKRKRPLPLPLAAFVAREAALGLDYAHKKKDSQGRDMDIVHRDVSPQNILIAYDGRLKVIDFGIAKAQNRSQQTQAGILKGKFGYMSPEQVRGQPIDRRSDIFALGVIFYELLTGERLFVGESDFSTLEKVRNADVLPPRSYNDQIPEELERIVLQALVRSPEKRYQWAGEMAEDLTRFLAKTRPPFGQKELAAAMGEMFAAEMGREQERMAGFAAIAPPAAASPAKAPPPVGPDTEAPKTILDLSPPPADDEPPEQTETNTPVLPRTQPPVLPSPPTAPRLRPRPRSEPKPVPAPPPRRPPTQVAPPVAVEATSAQTLEIPALVPESAPAPPAPAPPPLPAPPVVEAKTLIRPESSFRSPSGVVREPPAAVATVIRPEPSLRRTPPGRRPPSQPPVLRAADPGDDTTSEPSLAEETRALPAPPERAPPVLGARPKRSASPALKAIIVGVGIGVVLVAVLMTLLAHGPAGEAGARVPAEPAESARLPEAPPPAPVAAAVPAPPPPAPTGTASTSAAALPPPVEAAAPAPPAPAAAPPAAVVAAPPPPAAAPAPAVPAPPAATPPEPEPPSKPGLEVAAPQPAAPAPIQIMIETDPDDAEIFVDRQRVGRGAYVLNSTDPTHLYHLRAVAPGRRPAEKTSSFAVAQEVTLVLKEGGAPVAAAGGGGRRHARGGPLGSLIISSRPVAKVFVDGRSTERYTPVAPNDPLQIPSGDHLIHFESDDGKKADREVSIQPHTLTKLLGVTLN